MIVHTRYAIRIWAPKQPELGHWWFCQGLAKSPTFAFAILYATPEHAEKAIKKNLGKRVHTECEIVPINCEVPE